VRIRIAVPFEAAQDAFHLAQQDRAQAFLKKSSGGNTY
jgi:hypothetical protein